MSREALLQHLDAYQTRHPEEEDTVARIVGLLTSRERAFHRDCFDPGHITSSAWIVSRESGSILLTHHRKLERWLQLGGHADGESDVLASAIREAEEESGLRDFEVLPLDSRSERAVDAVILDVDVHLIPARADEPAHEHHDIRFLLRVSDRQTIERQVVESKEIRWFTAAAGAPLLAEESLARMARKATDWLSRSPVGPG